MMQDRMSTASRGKGPSTGGPHEGSRGPQDAVAFGASEAAAYAREYARVTMAPRRRRQRTRQIARRIMAAWRAWQAAGRLDPR